MVEDERDIGDLLSFHIKQMGFETEHALSGEEALAKLNKIHFDLIILDWMLPGLSGVEIAQLVRKMDTFKEVAILMLTAKSDPDSIVEGLESGADDYVTKPFSAEVLKARIQSLLRRMERMKMAPKNEESPQQPVDDIELGPLRVSLKVYKAYLKDEELNLTPSEFKLLTTMLQERGRVLTRARLIEEVQGEGITVIGRTIDTHVFGLRKKLGEFSDLIETVRGVGYRIRDDIF
ncbi:MAG: response regulator transcription factor [Bdellovibrionales bacterium]|nr:response regulator transcription factor [Bdellovibrionales bacterium]MCB0411304.1 response regulator transcription factor [Bdellovibrionales bacterium]